MDIMRAHQAQVNTDLAQSESNSSRLTGVSTQWLNLALSIEERQYACFNGLINHSTDIV